MSPSEPQITVAMISMNEERAVGKVIADIKAAAPQAHILLVDSSKDRTPEIAAAAGAEVLRQFPPKGYGPAMMRALTSAPGQVVVTLDCDDTYPTDRIMQMADYVLSGQADVVDASRLEKARLHALDQLPGQLGLRLAGQRLVPAAHHRPALGHARLPHQPVR